ncbi:MAG: SOS response-associated peptidase [Steroidobacteraceae bacterium]
MCGRFALYSPAAEIQRAFGVRPDELQPRYNIAPSQPLTTVRLNERGGREIADLDWGLLPAWAAMRQGSYRPMINARADSAADKPYFRAAWRHRRCLIPADGWYEWQQTDGARQPWFMASARGDVLGLAGLWEQPVGSAGRGSCAILTIPASPELAHIHGRMPAVLAPEHWPMWLGEIPVRPGALEAMLEESSGREFISHRVGPRVNNPRHDGPELVEGP